MPALRRATARATNKTRKVVVRHDDDEAAPRLTVEVFHEDGVRVRWRLFYEMAAAEEADFDEDAGGGAYQRSSTGDQWTLRSAGPDRSFGTADDLILDVDVSQERRDLTVDRLDVINLAIRLYNEDWLSPPPPQVPAPLSATWSTAYGQLVARGYLSNATEFRTDGWGADFVRTGTSGPVVSVRSVNVGN